MALRRRAVLRSAVALTLLACCCWGSVQHPVMTLCQSEPSLVTVRDFSIKDAKVGRNMTIHYVGELHSEIQGSPISKFTMWNSNGVKMPCVQDMGSCTYKNCGGQTEMEKMIGAPWNNTCPIPAGTYSSEMVFFMHPVVRAVLGNGTFRIKMEVTNGDQKVQCQMIDVHIEK
ncbi:uncharacterized protein LOC144141470 [Haemaphysalis longicornis]